LLLGRFDLVFLWSLLGILLEVGRAVKLVRVLSFSAERSARSSDKKALLLGRFDLVFLWSLLGILLEVGRAVKLVRVLSFSTNFLGL